MKERPILFNSKMVNAILDGRKTQTRRLKGLNKPHKSKPDIVHKRDENGEWIQFLRCPYGQPGDRLWVRETWATPGNWDEIKPSELIEYPGFNTDLIAYRATENYGDAYFKWRPSIHMPRWASRITLEITEVRVEQLQEISLEDCEKYNAAAELGWTILRFTKGMIDSLDAIKTIKRVLEDE
jgi:hypothetical protein